MTTRSRGGKGNPDDTGRPGIPLVSCPRHPGSLSTGSCPACQLEAAKG